MQRHPKHLIITYSCSNDNKKILYIIYAKSLPLFEVMSTIYSRMKKKKCYRKLIIWVQFQSGFHFYASNHFVTHFQTEHILFWKETLQAQCFYLQQQPSVVFSVWEPKAVALQVNLPVWSQTGCTLGQGRGDYTCVWVNTLCVCVYSVLELAQPPQKSALKTLDSIAQYYDLWDFSYARVELMDFGHSPCSAISLLFPYIVLWPLEERGFLLAWLLFSFSVKRL